MPNTNHQPEAEQKPPSRLVDFINTHVRRIPFVQKILFVYNLYIMIKAGLSIVAALDILSAQMESKHLQSLVSEIKIQVEKGQQLSEALALYPAVFPPMYVSMIAAGETAGKLEQALNQVAEQMKKSHELTARIRGAMMYPAVIVTAMAGIGVEMVGFVLPKIIGMFDDFKVALPLPTRILIAIVRFTEHYGVFMVVGTVGLVAFILWLIRKPPVKRVVHAIHLRLPIAGAIIKKINLARFTMTLSSLLESTIPIIEAVKIAASVQSNVLYRAALLEVSETLKKGQTLSEILSQYRWLFPPMVTQMIMVGEQSGQVETMLKELSSYYGNEVDTTMKNFSTIIEPVIILILGFAVAGIAVSVIMPIYSLAQNF